MSLTSFPTCLGPAARSAHLPHFVFFSIVLYHQQTFSLSLLLYLVVHLHKLKTAVALALNLVEPRSELQPSWFLLHLSPLSFCDSLKSSGSIPAAFLKYHIPLVCLATFDEALYRRPSGSPRRLRSPHTPHPAHPSTLLVFPAGSLDMICF